MLLLKNWNGKIESRVFSTREEKYNNKIRVQPQKELNFLTRANSF